MRTLHLPLPSSWRIAGLIQQPAIRPGFTELLTCALTYGWLKSFPTFAHEIFVGGAARLVALVTGSPFAATDHGWILPETATPVEVTAACSATDFYIMVTLLVSWQLARRFTKPSAIALVPIGALISAIPVTLAVNTLRIVTVSQAHRWVIPQLPEAYDSFLHMLTGAAVFLPALILINLGLETSHARTTRSSSS